MYSLTWPNYIHESLLLSSPPPTLRDYVQNTHLLPSPLHTNLFLRNRKRVSIRQHRLAPSKRLRAGADANKILASAQPLALDQVGEESVQVTVEIGHVGARAHEAEHGRRAVGALEEIELVASDGRRGDGRGARGGDGACTAQSAQPDHDLVGVGAAVGVGGEDVVGDVGDYGGASVACGRSAF